MSIGGGQGHRKSVLKSECEWQGWKLLEDNKRISSFLVGKEIFHQKDKKIQTIKKNVNNSVHQKITLRELKGKPQKRR